MKTLKLSFAIILFFLFTSFSGHTKTTHVSKESATKKNILFLVHNKISQDMDITAVFLKKIILMGYEAQDLSLAPLQDGNAKRDSIDYGSGFFISEDGHFLTAYHVIERAETIILRKTNGNLSRAKVLIEDPINDIAILSAIGEQKENYWLPLANSQDANIGDEILVLGYQAADLVGPKPKIASGFISLHAGIGSDPTRFEIMAPVNAGCSGAAILNNQNEVIGVVSEQANDEWLFAPPAPLPPDISFGVKIKYARMLLEKCLEEIPRKSSKLTSLEDAINSTALVLINTQNVPTDLQTKRWDRIILVEFSGTYFYYIIHYTIFEFNKRWTDKALCEVLASGNIAASPVSGPSEIVEAFIKEMQKTDML